MARRFLKALRQFTTCSQSRSRKRLEASLRPRRLLCEGLEDRRLLAASDFDFTSANFSAPEGDATNTASVVQVTRSDTTGAESVDIVLTGNTATAGTDFTAGPVTIDFADGVATVSVSIELLGDNVVELDETIDLSFANFVGGGGAGGGQNTATFTILNDDSAVISINAPSEAEGAALGFSVTISNPVDVAVTADRWTADGTATTADGDYTALASSTVTLFAAGSTAALVIPVSTTTDNTVELNETLDLVLSALGAGGRAVTFSGGGPTLTGTGTILNDDSAVISINAPSEAEGAALGFSVTISNPVDVAVTADRWTADGTATTADGDYTALASSTVTLFAAGSTAPLTINVATTGDGKVELNEALSLILSNLSAGGRSVTFNGGGATLTGTGTIANDDAAVVSISGPSVAEGGTLAFSVTIDNPVDAAVTADRATAEGTATTADSDYTPLAAANGELFAANSTAAFTINVDTTVDSKVELNETLSLILSNLSAGGRSVTFNGGGAALTGTGTITNEDAAQVSISSPSVAEGGTLAFSVSIDNPVDVAVTAERATADGTATAADSDYTALASANVTLFAAESTAPLTINVGTTGDSKVELDEALSLILSNLSAGGRDVTFSGGGATLSGAGTIINEDRASLSINGVAANEDGTFTFTITSTNPSSHDLTVAVSTADATASAPGDYAAIAGGTATIAGDGVSTTTIVTVAVNDDRRVEGTETFSVDISNARFNGIPDPTRVVIGEDTGVGTILDNDSIRFDFESDTSVTEDYATHSVDVEATITAVGTGAVGLEHTLTVQVTDSGAGSASTVGTPADYAFSPQTFIFSAGSFETASQPATVTINEDIVFDPNETIMLSLGGLSSSLDGRATLGNTSHTVTINDDDTAATRRFDASAAGIYTIALNGGNIEIRQGAVVLVSEPIGGYQLVFNGTAAGSETLTIDTSAGVPIPGGGIVFNGGEGAGDNDTLAVIGSGQNAAYTPDAATSGNGTIVLTPGGPITFTGLEPVDITGMATATVLFPNANDSVTAQDGVDFTMGGANPAVRVSGTSGGVAFETVALWNNTTVVIDTATVDGNDTVALDSADTAHLITNLQVNTGAGADSISVGTGAAGLSFGGQVTLTTAGPITDGNAGATNVTAATLVATAGTGIDLDTGISFLTATTASGTVDIADSLAVQVSGANSADAWILASTAGITNAAAASLAVTNNASFSGTSITLGDQAGDAMNFGSLTFNSGGAADIAEDSGTQLSGTSTGDSLVLSSTEGIANAAAASLTVTDNASFSGTEIRLGDQAGDAMNFGSLTFNSAAGWVVIAEDSSTLLSGASTAFIADLSSTAAITNAAGASLSVTWHARFSGTSITLGNQPGDAMNFRMLTFNSGGAVNIAEDSSTYLGATSTADSLVLASTGAIGNATAASLTVTNNASFSGTQITLGKMPVDAMNFGSLTFNCAGGWGVVDIVEDSSTLLSGASTAALLFLFLSSTGAITNGAGASLSVYYDARFSGTSITLGDQPGDAMNFGLLNFNSAGAVNIATDSSASISGDNSEGTIQVTSLGSLRVPWDITGTGDITLTATETPAAGDTLTIGVSATVSTTGGNILLQAGDGIVLDSFSRVSASGSVTLNVAFGGDADGSTSNVGGSITSSAEVQVNGNAQADFVNVSPYAWSGKGLRFNGNAGSDILRMEGSFYHDNFYVDDNKSDGVVRRTTTYSYSSGAFAYQNLESLWIDTVDGIDRVTFQMNQTETFPGELLLTDVRVDGGNWGVNHAPKNELVRVPSGAPTPGALWDGLRIIGSSGDDTIEVGTFNPLAPVPGGPRFKLHEVGVLQVFGEGGEDTLTNSTSVNSFLVGGDGDDTLTGGQMSDVLVSGIGNDRLYGRGGNDYLFADYNYLPRDAAHPSQIAPVPPAHRVGGDYLDGGAGIDLGAYFGVDTLKNIERLNGRGGVLTPSMWLKAKYLRPGGLDDIIDGLLASNVGYPFPDRPATPPPGLVVSLPMRIPAAGVSTSSASSLVQGPQTQYDAAIMSFLASDFPTTPFARQKKGR